MSNTRNSSSSRFSRCIEIVQRITGSAYFHFGVGVVVLIAALWDLEGWHATIMDGEIRAQHGVTLMGIAAVLKELPEVVMATYELYQKKIMKKEEKQVPILNITLLKTAAVLADVVKILLRLHDANVRQEVVHEVHEFVMKIKELVDGHHETMKAEMAENDDAETETMNVEGSDRNI